MKSLHVLEPTIFFFVAVALCVQGADSIEKRISRKDVGTAVHDTLGEHGFVLPPLIVDGSNGVTFVSERIKGPGTLDRIVGTINPDGKVGGWIYRFQRGPSEWAIVGKLLYDAKPESEAIETELRKKLDPTSDKRLDSNKQIEWQNRIKAVSPGMKRSEVEALLPRYSYAVVDVGNAETGTMQMSLPKITSFGGGKSSEVYWVDRHWRVGVGYNSEDRVTSINLLDEDAGAYAIPERDSK